MGSTLWYMSFADEDGFLGAVVTEGEGLIEATKAAWRKNINPGGAVQGFPVASCPPEYVDRLLTRADVSRLAYDQREGETVLVLRPHGDRKLVSVSPSRSKRP